MTETKHDKFVRLAAARLDKAVVAMQQLTKLNSHNYEFSMDEAEAIVRTLEQTVTDVRIGFDLPIEEIKPEPVVLGKMPEPLELNREETLYLMKAGPEIDRAINAITDGQPEEAKFLLLNLMRS